jgi:YD repeat-containing protein
VKVTYDYEAAFGRMIRRTGPTVPTGQQTFVYSTVGKLRSVADAAGNQERFEYDSQGTRALRVGAEGERTVYASGLYELEQGSDGATVAETRRIMVDGRAIAELRRTADGNVSKSSLHRDHLGSVALVTDGTSGAVRARPTTDAFGATLDTDPDITSLGFTGHRTEAGLGLIDMIGRLVQPEELGRPS